MRLKSFGCSFIFGSELPDDGWGGPYATPSSLTWPALLAKHLNCEYECYARPGSGNLQILEAILNQVSASNGSDLFVIGWTWVDRFDYYPVNPPTPSRSPWRTIVPNNTDDLAKVYFRDIHSEYRDKFVSLSYIKLAMDTMRQKNIPFIMTYMDHLLFNESCHVSPSVIDMQKYIRPYMNDFDGQAFLEWSRANGYPVTEMWHPLEEAHRVASDLMIKVFDKQKIVVQAQ